MGREVRQVIVAEAGIQSGEVVRHAAIIDARMGRLKPSLAGDPVALTRYAPAFNGNSNAGIAPNKSHETILSGDIIFHF
ncbi:MAG TPA: hypothetical protein VGO76_08440 [Luteibacter sp.]|nr:hypothetical protein [Luteibacter sp.]